MSDAKVISPTRLRNARGDRSRAKIAEAGGNKFTAQDLYNWEKGNNLPHPKKLPYLLKALNVTFDEVAIDVRAARI